MTEKGDILCKSCIKSTAKICAKCEEKIVKSCYKVLGKYWHPKCLICCACNKGFNDGYVEKEEKVWHLDCYQKKKAKK